MNKRLLLDVGKYVLAVGLLVWVIRSNWSPAPSPRAVAAVAASTVALASSPLTAAVPLYPGRGQPTGLGQVWERHAVEGEPIRWGFFLAAVFCFGAALFLTLVRWHRLVRALDLPLTFRDAMRYGLVGIFFNTFLPGSVGGDIIKATVLARGQKRRTAAVATVVMDRAIALWALVWFVAMLGGACWLAGLLTGGVASFIVTVALAVAGVTGLGWLLLGLLPELRAERFAGRLGRLPGIGGTVSELWRAVWMYRKQPGTVYGVMLLSWVGHIGFVGAFYFGIKAFWSPGMGLIPSFAQHFLLVPMGLVMQALVPTPGGAGGGEWGFAALYVLFGAPEANGVLASLIQRVFSWLAGLAGYVVYLVAAPSLPKAEAPSEPAKAAQPPRALAG